MDLECVTILKKNKILRLLDFKTYYEVIIIHTVWYWCKDRHMNRTG